MLAMVAVRARRAASEEAPVIDPEVRAATTSGRARVLVELRLPEQPPALPAALRRRSA